VIVWLLWEDQSGSAPKGFGPHSLLLNCLSDDLGEERWKLEASVRSSARKGNNKLLNSLKQDLERLRDDGFVVAVFDRDKAHLLRGKAHETARCRSALLATIKSEAPGDYQVILLEDNAETLVQACLLALGESAPEKKPTRDERDGYLRAVAGRPDLRTKVRNEIPSFDRLVLKVGELVRALPTSGR
jgi:hypothetical protein